MERLTRESALMATAHIWASRGTCARLQVGCVVEKDGRILVQGYNGVPAGMKHCEHPCTCKVSDPHYLGHRPGCSAGMPCLRAVHAEANVMAFSARWGIQLQGAQLYSTHMPCVNCAMLIINAGIIRVVYARDYRIKDGIELLRDAFIQVDRHDMIDP